MDALSTITALVVIVGFAIQQCIQLLDIPISAWIKKTLHAGTIYGRPTWRRRSCARPTWRRRSCALPGGAAAAPALPGGGIPGGLSEADFKKAITSVLSVLLALGVVVLTKNNISVLGQINHAWKGTVGDWLVTALTLGAGTEGANTFLKYVGYVKDAKKPPEPSPAPLPITVVVFPPTASVKVGTTVQFRAQISNTDNTQGVVWSVVQGNGGAIEQNGLYTAPTTAGTYHVAVTIKDDVSKFALSTVTVTP